MMDFNIIDAHSHLWLRQDTEVNGLPIRTLTNGRSLFMGEERQMVPPFMIDGRNSAEVFLSNKFRNYVRKKTEHGFTITKDAGIFITI